MMMTVPALEKQCLAELRNCLKGKHLLLLGAGIMQIPALQLARSAGMTVTAVDGNPDAPGIALADAFLHIDLKDPDSIAAAANVIQESRPIHGVCTVGTDFSTSVACIARDLDLPGIQPESAEKARYKHLMREAFVQAGMPTPCFTVLTAEDLLENPDKVSMWDTFPCVLKPVDNMGARGVSIARNHSEFTRSLESALKDSHIGIAIAERFITGPEYSIDAVWVAGELIFTGIAERHIYFDPYRVELGHSFPAQIDSVRQEALRQAMQAAGAALGIRSGALKGDVFWENGRAVIGEVAARLSGGFMSGWTFPLHSGTSSIAAVLCDSVGVAVPAILLQQLRTHPESNSVHERAIISFPGVVSSVEGLDCEPDYPEIAAIWQAADAGSKIDLLTNNIGKCGNIILRSSNSSDFDELNRRTQDIFNNIHIRMEDNNPDSLEFLLTAKPRGPLLYQLNQWTELYQHSPEDLILHADTQPRIFRTAEWWESIERDWIGRSIQDHLETALARDLITFSNEESCTYPDISELITLRAVSRAGIQGLEYIIRQIKLKRSLNE
ncbi:ATP-grasp domain-containing protein [Spirochaeta dissipatitropha]